MGESNKKGVQMNSAEVSSRMPDFTIGDLVDLALCSPEVGAVNFNILRILLRDMIEKTGIDKKPVKMSDVEAHQVENFKNYVQGATVGSPMPGVLRMHPQGQTTGMAYGVKPSEDGRKTVVAASETRTNRSPQRGGVAANNSHVSLGPPGSPVEIHEKVARLEKHLEALYQLPGNQEILDKAKGEGMTVTDMWQIIQLNNRIAAAEAAIQKMASLIEDLARGMSRVKSDAKSYKNQAGDLALTNSDLQIQGLELSEKCGKFADVVETLRDEMDKMKRGWKNDRDMLEKTLGINLGTVPTFMKPRPERGLVTTADDEDGMFERGTQTFVHLKEGKDKRPVTEGKSRGVHMKSGGTQDDGPPRKAKPVEERIPPQNIVNMSPEEIAELITPEEVASITPEIYKMMTPEQKKVVKQIRGPVERKLPPQKPPMGFNKMKQEDLVNIHPDSIVEKMGYEEALSLKPEVLAKMSEHQRVAVQKVIKTGPPPPQKKPKIFKKELGVASMPLERIKNISPTALVAKMPYKEAASLPPEIISEMSPEQQEAIKKIVDAGPPARGSEAGSQGAEVEGELAEETVDDEDDSDDFFLFQPVTKPESEKTKKSPKPPKAMAPAAVKVLTKVPPEELVAKLTPAMAASIPEEEIQRRFSPAQAEEIKKISRSYTPPRRPSDDTEEADEPINLIEATASAILQKSPSELLNSMTLQQLLDLTQEELDKMTPEQKKAVMEARKKAMEDHQFPPESGSETRAGEEEGENEGDESEAGRRKSVRDRTKPGVPHRKVRESKHHHKHHHHKDKDHPHDHGQVDILKGPIPTVGVPLPPMTLEKYLENLPAEEAANLAADAVQRELQKQYGQLQGMQRQLAQDIQAKMEFIYQKLLKEIATQQITTSPYMAIGDEDRCLGPGVCTGHGMPAGIAVCQFQEARESEQKGKAEGAKVPIPDGSVCPGPGVCPANAVCPHCQGQIRYSQQQGPEELQSLRVPTHAKKSTAPPAHIPGAGYQFSDMDENLLKEMKSLMLLDLEKIREDMKVKKFGAFDEKDIVERLGAVWEALKILKHNEEAIAIKISRQDAIMKKIPVKTIEKLNQIPDENLEAIASGQFQKPMYIPEGAPPLHKNIHKDLEELPKSPLRNMASPGEKEDIQTLFNNLANVISECSEQKDRVDQMSDVMRIMEAGMVTKQMLLDSLSDKADKGLINTKVSYDEFGNTVDELHNQLHNLMVEGYQRNENWKKVTSDLATELADKLDKVELTPVRIFFKSNLKNLEDKVKNLTDLVDEPDPAGTRKRLLRDYNCLSCDRMVNIKGVTNGPTLPQIGPVLAGHPTVSRRALDLHRMRMKKEFDPNSKNLSALERRDKSQNNPPSNRFPNADKISNDVDIMHVVNRYTGGSHTALTTGDRVAATRQPQLPRLNT